MAAATTTPEPPTSMISKVKRSGDEVTRRILELLLGAFTLVTALTWNDAVKSMFAKGGLFDFAGFGRWAPWVNAIFITLLVYLVTMWLKQYISKPCTNLCAQTLEGIAGSVAVARATEAPVAAAACTRRPRRCHLRRRRRFGQPPRLW